MSKKVALFLCLIGITLCVFIEQRIAQHCEKAGGIYLKWEDKCVKGTEIKP